MSRRERIATSHCTFHLQLLRRIRQHILMAALRSRCGHYILSCGFFFFYLLFFLAQSQRSESGYLPYFFLHMVIIIIKAERHNNIIV